MTTALFYSERRPDDEGPIAFDFAAFLATDETISTFGVTLPDAIAHATPASKSGAVVTAWTKLGTAGARYRIVASIVTSAGRHETMECELWVATP